MAHVDVKKPGDIPTGGGHRVPGRAQGTANKRTSTTTRKGANPVTGYGYLHTALDDHSRLAYTETLTNEKKETSAVF